MSPASRSISAVMGCLSAPSSCWDSWTVLAALAVGWLYRDRLAGEAAPTGRGPVQKGGRLLQAAGARALLSAKSKIDSLNGWRADSVVLTAAEVASMIGVGLDPEIRKQLDSLAGGAPGRLDWVKARSRTARLPGSSSAPWPWHSGPGSRSRRQDRSRWSGLVRRNGRCGASGFATSPFRAMRCPNSSPRPSAIRPEARCRSGSPRDPGDPLHAFRGRRSIGGPGAHEPSGPDRR